jgi:hypothetical protein
MQAIELLPALKYGPLALGLGCAILAFWLLTQAHKRPDPSKGIQLMCGLYMVFALMLSCIGFAFQYAISPIKVVSGSNLHNIYMTGVNIGHVIDESTNQKSAAILNLKGAIQNALDSRMLTEETVAELTRVRDAGDSAISLKAAECLRDLIVADLQKVSETKPRRCEP